jgi:choice-of-anchor A domain-containing protein
MRNRILRGIACLALAFTFWLTPSVQAAFVGLGQAGNYTLFCVSNTQWQMNNSTEVGLMGAGPGVTYNWSGSGGPYTGPINYQTGGAVPPVNNLGGTPKPTAIATDLTQAVLDARAAANGTIPGNAIGNSTPTITGAGGSSENVYDITGVNMTNGNVLISGTANETFFFRVNGDFNVGNSTIRVTGGATPDHVYWYFPNSQSIKSPNGSWDGTILALNSGVQFDNTPSALGPVRGRIIASDDVNNNQNYVFSVVSGFDIVAVPEPGSLGLLALAGLSLLRRRH